MIAICIDDYSVLKVKLVYLTKGNIYNIDNFINDKSLLRVIQDDSGNVGYYYPCRFITLEEHRNIKLNNILK